MIDAEINRTFVGSYRLDVSLWTRFFERLLYRMSDVCSIDVLISIKLLKARRSIRDYYYPVMVEINFQFDTAEKVQLIKKKKISLKTSV